MVDKNDSAAPLSSLPFRFSFSPPLLPPPAPRFTSFDHRFPEGIAMLIHLQGLGTKLKNEDGGR